VEIGGPFAGAVALGDLNADGTLDIVFARTFEPGGRIWLNRDAATFGNFDEDGDVDGNDFLAWQRGLGISAGATRAQGNADGDGDVDRDDVSIWASQFGDPPPAAAAALAPDVAMTLQEESSDDRSPQIRTSQTQLGASVPFFVTGLLPPDGRAAIASPRLLQAKITPGTSGQPGPQGPAMFEWADRPWDRRRPRVETDSLLPSDVCLEEHRHDYLASVDGVFLRWGRHLD
jgi:hypothetical protein